MTEILTEQATEQPLIPDIVAPERVRTQMSDEELLEHVETAVQAAEDKKAIDLVVLKLVNLTSFTDFFLICHGNSSRQVQAIVDEITDRMRIRGVRPLNTEGYTNGEWVLIDFGPFVVHVFTAQSRSFYDLERLWRDAEQITLPAPARTGLAN
ncbi:MAG: ribosome silencing factor [Blastocatellia bacterium]